MTRMIDISDKSSVARTAVAEGRITLKASTIAVIREGGVKKGDVLAISQLAGIQAAKETSRLIPLCHQIPLSSVNVEFEMHDNSITARTKVRADYKTGVEMEALCATAAALLNLWDMVKYLEKDEAGQYPTAKIDDLRVVMKTKEAI